MELSNKSGLRIGAAFAAKIAASVVILAGATGAAFAAWIDNGAQILLAMAASGMSWCF